MKNVDTNIWPHWPTFLFLFIPTLFIPVFPLYKGIMFLGVLPVWAVYASLVVMPGLWLFSIPLVYTHIWLSYYLAKRISTFRENPIRFSITSILAVIGFLAVAISFILAFGPLGFSAIFATCWLGFHLRQWWMNGVEYRKEHFRKEPSETA